jgi:hypothetical protein
VVVFAKQEMRTLIGTDLSLFTIFHVLLSLVGILAGLIAITGFLRGRILSTSNRVFLGSTALTSITGFFFPFRGMTPGIMIGIVCSVMAARVACFLQLGTPGQAAHSSNRRMISMSLYPNRMREPHNMKGTP